MLQDLPDDEDIPGPFDGILDDDLPYILNEHFLDDHNEHSIAVAHAVPARRIKEVAQPVVLPNIL